MTINEGTATWIIKTMDGQRFLEAVINIFVHLSALKSHNILNNMMKSHGLLTFPSFYSWLPSPCWNIQHNFSDWYTQATYDISRFPIKLQVHQNNSLLKLTRSFLLTPARLEEGRYDSCQQRVESICDKIRRNLKTSCVFKSFRPDNPKLSVFIY